MGQVGVVHEVLGNAIANGAVDDIKGELGPCVEASPVATGGNLEKVETVDTAEINAKEVAEGTCKGILPLDRVQGWIDEHGVRKDTGGASASTWS